MRRAVGPSALFFVLAASVAHCSTTGGPLVGVTTVVDSGLACGPVDVTASGYDGDAGVPERMRPPHPAHLAACTSQQVADYASCQGGKNTALCPQFGKGGASAICGACVETQHDAPDGGPAPSWGVVVIDSSTGTASFNIEGCVDDALGQVTDEYANGGRGSCGDLLHASYGCQETACSACGGSPINSCGPLLPGDAATGDATAGDATTGDAAVDAAQPVDAGAAEGGDAGCYSSDFALCEAWAVEPGVGQCASYDGRVKNPSGPCAALFDGTAPPDVSNCFPDASYALTQQQQQDPQQQQQQEIDWLTRIVGYMCSAP